MKVKEVLSRKGSDIYSIRSDKTVYDAIKMMSELNIGALLVIDDGKFVGIISERDYRDKVILKGRQSKSTPVKDIMTDKVFCVSYDEDVKMCMRIMTQRKIRHLPVLKGEDLEGLISIGDVVKSVIDEQKYEIESLREFIGGSYPV